MTENPAGVKLWKSERCIVRLQWEPRDLWVGLFWRKSEICWHIYICLIPLIPLHISILRRL